MMAKSRNFFAAAALTLALGAFSPSSTRSASAVVLQQKWQAGQTSTYNLTILGTLDVKSSDQTPVPWAGMPLSVPITGTGQVAFDTVSVNAAGNAIVRTRIPQMQLRAAAFGMSADVSSKENAATLSLNGAPGKTFDLPFLTNPPYGISVSPLGQIESVENLTGTTTKAPISAATLQKWLSVVPQLWPSRDVKAGDTWTVSPKIPLDTAPNGALNLGTVSMKLIGEETVGGTALQHITLSGTLLIDSAQAALLNAKMASKANTSKGNIRLVSDSKVVNGDIWFDAAQGRISRMTMKTVSSNTLSGTTKPDAAGKTRDWTSTQGFDGTFGWQLN